MGSILVFYQVHMGNSQSQSCGDHCYWLVYEISSFLELFQGILRQVGKCPRGSLGEFPVPDFGHWLVYGQELSGK